jgi:hypothetical protein
VGTPAPAGFVVKPVRNRTPGGLVGARTLGMVLHVQAGNGALSGWFNNPAAGASSTWWAGKAGGREQYGNPDTDKFWAQAAGNGQYHSIETEGRPSEPLTAAQIESCAVAYAWGHTRYGWPFRLAERPGEPGLGWHGMGGKAWGNHPGCPGDKRKAQRTQILARARQIADGQSEEDEFMDVKNPVTGEQWPAEKALWSIWTYAFNAARDAAVARRLAEASAKAGKPLTAAQIDDIASATVAAFGKDYDASITLTPKEN